MSGRKLRWLGFGLVASAGAVVLALTSMMNAGFAYGDTPMAPVGIDPPTGDPDVVYAELMGPTGVPIPQDGSFMGPAYMSDVFTRFLEPNFPTLTFPTFPTPATDCTAPCDVNGLATPEGLYPLTGVNSLPLDTSVSQGETILNNAILGQLPLLAGSGSDLGVLGYSQSATISSLEMQNPALEAELAALGMTNNDVNFVLIGDPDNPNGGLFERFEGLDMASLGAQFYGATPEGLFPTAIYTLEYDGFADFPQYPIDLPADINALLGAVFVHGDYPTLTQTQLDQAFLLPGSMTEGPDNPAEDVCADCMTNYFMIPETAPLVSLLGDIPVIGGPLEDLLGPDLTYLINLGYGPDDVGYSTPADVPTQFGLFPDVNPVTVFNELVSGAQQGITNFIADLTGSGPNPLSLASLDSLLPAVSDPSAAVSAAAGDPLSFTDIVNALSSAASTAYGVLLPTADIINTLLTSIPAYETSLFVDNLQNGDLLDAIGLPIAAETAAVTLMAGFEFRTIYDAAATIAQDLTGLF